MDRLKQPPPVTNDESEPFENLTLAQVLARRRSARELEAKIGRAASIPDVHNTTFGSNTPKKRPPTQKSYPRELPSNRPVPVGRDVCIGLQQHDNPTRRTVRHFDPRFEEHCGDLRDMHVERNYEFLVEQREQRRKLLEEAVRKRRKKLKGKKAAQDKFDPELQQSEHELERIKQGDLRRKTILREREVLKKVKEEEKEAVRRGKQPFFLKRKELRRKELRAQFEDLKKRKGGVKKFIAKRRRKIVGKERKNMDRPTNESS